MVLRHIPKNLSPELVKVLMEMGMVMKLFWQMRIIQWFQMLKE